MLRNTRPAALAAALMLMSSLLLFATPQQAPMARAAAPASVRFATFNASLNRGAAGQLIADLNGIASGDVTTSTAVLWARSTFPGRVTFEYGTDATFAALQGSVVATSTNTLQPVKVEVGGLNPGTRYVYRATDAAGATATGTFRTAAASGRAGLRFGVSGDWRGELAPYPAISNAAGRDLDFFVEHGDTIYADFPSPTVPLTQARTLDEFRAKHSEVYATRFGLNAWGDLRASTSVLATIDDYEVTNDFAGGAPPSSDRRFLPSDTQFIKDTPLFENGLQAFGEYNPRSPSTGPPRRSR